MNNLIHDLPSSAADGAAPILLDADAGRYVVSKKGEGYVYVEKYAQNKNSYTPLPVGTPSIVRPNAWLDKETNVRDIGGGMVSFERHFAVIPKDWFDYEEVNVAAAASYRQKRIEEEDGNLTLVYYEKRIFSIAINPVANGNTQIISQAKSSRTYVKEAELESLPEINSLLPIYTARRLDEGQSVTFTDISVQVPSVRLYLADIYEVTTYTATITITSTFS